jgi:POT family proton-dependent oligopeptide transporter
MSQNTADEFFQKTVLGHPAGLFVLFFTEMWERFSIMECVPFVLFFNIVPCRLAWSIEDAMALYGTYTMSVYFTPVIEDSGGSLLRYRWSVVLGASMTLATHRWQRNAFFYILNWVSYYRNGLFKPNMTSIISNAYHNHPEKKTVLIQCTIWV